MSHIESVDPSLSTAPGGYGGPPPGYGGPPPGYGGAPPGGGYAGGYGPPGGMPPPPPPGFGGMGPGGDPTYAASKVKAPAITMLICSAIGVLLQLVSLAMNILGTGLSAAGSSGSSDQFAALMSGVVGMVFNVIASLVSGFCIFGLLKMMKLQSRGLSYAAVILSMIPCFGACWCLNLPLGVWALVVLADPQVKQSFT